MKFIESNGKKLAAILCVASAFPVVATIYAQETQDGWHGDRYIENRETVKGWQEIEGESYYFDSDGKLDKETTNEGVVAKPAKTIKEDMKRKINSESAIETTETTGTILRINSTTQDTTPTPIVSENPVMYEDVQPIIEVDNNNPLINNVQNAIIEDQVEVVNPESTPATQEVNVEQVETPIETVEQANVEDMPVEVNTTETVETENTEEALPVEEEVQSNEQPQVENVVVENVQESQPVLEVATDTNSDLNQAIANAALGMVGTTDGWQCTEVATASLNEAGVSASVVWPDEYAQYGYVVDASQAQPGNLIIYKNAGRGDEYDPDHVAVYIGNGQAVHGNYQARTIVADAVLYNGNPGTYIQVVQ